MAGTITATTIQNDTSSPPTFRNSTREIGTLCRAWVNFNGTGTVAIRSSFNVSSITDNALGDYTINFTNAMPDADYSIVAFAQQSGTKILISGNPDGVAPTTTAYKLVTSSGGGGTAHVDATYVFAAVFR
jgi:hypothetical protein